MRCIWMACERVLSLHTAALCRRHLLMELVRVHQNELHALSSPMDATMGFIPCLHALVSASCPIVRIAQFAQFAQFAFRCVCVCRAVVYGPWGSKGGFSGM